MKRQFTLLEQVFIISKNELGFIFSYQTRYDEDLECLIDVDEGVEVVDGDGLEQSCHSYIVAYLVDEEVRLEEFMEYELAQIIDRVKTKESCSCDEADKDLTCENCEKKGCSVCDNWHRTDDDCDICPECFEAIKGELYVATGEEE